MGRVGEVATAPPPPPRLHNAQTPVTDRSQACVDPVESPVPPLGARGGLRAKSCERPRPGRLIVEPLFFLLPTGGTIRRAPSDRLKSPPQLRKYRSELLFRRPGLRYSNKKGVNTWSGGVNRY